MSAPTFTETPAGVTLRFLDPPPGLRPLTSFVLSGVEGAAELYTLRSLDVPGTRLFLIDPEPYFPGYAPSVDEAVLSLLAPEGSPVAVLAVVNPGADAEPPTVNLLAPVLVNLERGVAAQVVLDDDFPLRAALVPPVS